jgi:hypothetical protein
MKNTVSKNILISYHIKVILSLKKFYETDDVLVINFFQYIYFIICEFHNFWILL